ncbi:hypothetical protein [Methanosarcina lacustris]|nr:hypothetical protein [Methanosarcina lacustris]
MEMTFRQKDSIRKSLSSTEGLKQLTITAMKGVKAGQIYPLKKQAN